MHVPSRFAVDDEYEIVDFIRTNAFGTLVTHHAGIPCASHIPFMVHKGESVVLSGHLAKANEQWQHLQNDAQVLLIFQGPHAYISPTWYESSGVPTWNYTAVHVYGSVKLIHEADQLGEMVDKLSKLYEGQNVDSWIPAYPEQMLTAIVGFEVTVTSLQAQYKLSQNRSAADQRNVIKALQSSERDNERQIASMMQKRLK